MVKIEKIFLDMVKKSSIVLFRYILILLKRNETNQNETTEIPKLFRFGCPLDNIFYMLSTMKLQSTHT